MHPVGRTKDFLLLNVVVNTVTTRLSRVNNPHFQHIRWCIWCHYSDEKDPFNTKINLNYVSRFISHRAVNKGGLGYTKQSVNIVQENKAIYFDNHKQLAKASSWHNVDVLARSQNF